MEMLKQDGVPEGSELYFKALDLFRNSVCRAQYKNMQDPANRVAWIEWTWTNGKLKQHGSSFANLLADVMECTSFKFYDVPYEQCLQESMFQ